MCSFFTLSFFPAPWFCPTKEVMAMPKEVLTIQNTASIFPKADQAAAVSVPKVFSAAWMAIFVMANRIDSTAVGIPS